MQRNLSPGLQPIYDLELSLGNQVDRVREPISQAFPLTVLFKYPIHRLEVESKIRILSPVKWFSISGFAGYVSEDSRQSLHGPAVIEDEIPLAVQKLSKNLLAIYHLELSLGNTVKEINEQALSSCSLEINFNKPLHKTKIAATLSLSSSVRWWENHDAHYPIEGGYACNETGHVLAGPLSVL